MRASAAALAASYALPACGETSRASDLRVGVVGAGIAGLLCAYRLDQAGVRVRLYDAASRAGGRMRTARGKLADDQLAELGGEFIDTGHYTLRRLARELDVTLDDVTDYPREVRADTYFFGGKHVIEPVLAESFRPLAKRMQQDLAASEKDPGELARLDALSIAEYLDAITDLDPTLRSVLEVAYRGEYGREIEEQSAFNLLWLIDSHTPDPFRIFGDSDERFHAHRGSDTLPDLLAKKLQGQLALEHRLVRVGMHGNGRLRVTLDRDGTSVEETFDKVVLALPWTLLRSVELDVELPAAKRTMIDTLGYGTNTKLMGQFHSRVWLTDHAASGSAFVQSAPQCLWDTSRGQAGKSGVLTVFLGGHAGNSAGQGSAEARLQGFLPDIDRVFPGSEAAYREGSALRMHWPSAELALGSYACYLPRQAAWSGTEGERVGNLYFCGEHTSEDFQGYMEGAAASGERVSDEILAAVGLAQRAARRVTVA